VGGKGGMWLRALEEEGLEEDIQVNAEEGVGGLRTGESWGEGGEGEGKRKVR